MTHLDAVGAAPGGLDSPAVPVLPGWRVLEILRIAVIEVMQVRAAAVVRTALLEADLGLDSLGLAEVLERTEVRLRLVTGLPVLLEDLEVARLDTVGELVDHASSQLTVARARGTQPVGDWVAAGRP